jgi:hypothetical protein
MLHRTTWLLLHYLAQTRIPGRRSAIRDREIPASDITREEDRDVEDRRHRIGGVRWQLQLTIGGHIKSNLQEVYLESVQLQQMERSCTETYHRPVAC